MADAPQFAVDVTRLAGFAEAMRDGPRVLVKHLAKAYGQIGTYDIDQLRAAMPSQLNIRAKGLLKTFKSKATDPSRATDFAKLFVSEYTRWQAARIFQSGGTIRGKGKQLTILFDAARGAGGRRKYSAKRLRDLIAAGKVRFVPTPRGVLIVEDKGGLTKSGKGRKGSRSILLGMLRKTVSERKRIEFFAPRNQGMHEDILLTAIENAQLEIAERMSKGK